MCATFTDDEVDKAVVNDADEEIGVVASVDGDLAHVRPKSGAVDSIKSSIGWDSVAEETRPISGDSVREITDDAVRLEGDLPTAGEETLEETDSIRESGVDRGLEADPTELTRQEPEAEFDPGDTSSRTGTAVEPDDEHRSTDAAVDLDDEPRRTDATVDPGEQPRRTDAEMDPDAVRDADPSGGGPTTEGAERSNFEDGPEARRIARDEESDAGDQ
ncbi:hypothetical protein [Natronorubrum halophilum]|uniref:hypothetical protein n=1 Tax=Natronorubrum halophilum TaxID=1702106 RepID=UPI000EF6492F|nr:hypothetical protein [Natronorubrum halophilum]